MSDASIDIDPTAVVSPDDVALIEQDEIDGVVREIKRGFSLKDRLKKRGLRKVTLTVFLDENVGAEHRDVAEKVAEIDETIAQIRPILDGTKDDVVRQTAQTEIDRLEAERAPLVVKRDELAERVKRDSFTISLQAVPPVIAKDARRRARETMGIEQKDIPKDRLEDFAPVYNAHLLAMVCQTITDNSTGETNDSISFQEATDLFDVLPSHQGVRLAEALNEVQFRDAFSKTIEAQEDFS